MFCKSDCCEGQELCYDVSAQLSEIEQTDTESLEQPYEVFSFPPYCGEGPRLTLRWHLIALVTSYNIHKIPRHLTLQCLKSSSGFFLLHKNNFFLINQDNY